MTPTAPPRDAAFKRYTTILGILNVLLCLGAIGLFLAAIIFWITSYVFNDSGHVPEVVAPLVHGMLLDSLFYIVLFIWQLRARKELFAMVPKARTSMFAIGIAYLVIAVINLWQVPLLSVFPAAIGIWWTIVFSRASTRAAFESAPVVAMEPPPAE